MILIWKIWFTSFNSNTFAVNIFNHEGNVTSLVKNLRVLVIWTGDRSSNFLDLLSFLSLLCPAFPLILWALTPIINLLAWNSWCFCLLVEPWLIEFFVLKLKTCSDTFFFAVCICHELLFFFCASLRLVSCLK